MLAGVLAGCAAAPQTAAIEEGDNDPAEPVNRAVFDANMAADRAIMKPIAQAYQDYLPAEIRQSVHNASANLREPVVAANDLLQGRPARALNSAERFGINTTAGYAGVVDRAGQWNVPAHSADFGQTLAVWGVPEGPFVELPALGPSNLRDAVGSAVGIALDPLSWTGNPALSYLGYARTGAEFVDSEASISPISTSWNAARSTFTPPCAASIGNTANPRSTRRGTIRVLAAELACPAR